ncbi:MAG TPA: TonB-dependent receptor [Flavipsychrobacter sp.]|nr:TonB-dependent receptor [Flavipsychrobacter sp.]
MSMYFKFRMLLLWLVVFAIPMYAQDEKGTALVKGKLINTALNEAAHDVQVTIPFLRLLATSDGNGDFNFSHVPFGTHTMVIGGTSTFSDTVRIVVNKKVIDLGLINITANDQGNVLQNALIPTLLLDENNMAADDDGISSQNVSGLLTASRDPFQNTAAFIFGPYRFQPRGYDRSAQQIFVNGTPMNDIETGDAFWNQWGGLNDVFRGRSSTYGLEPSEYAMGGINGTVYFDATAANQRKQTRITYSNSNRQYRNRLMVTHNSGLLKGDWAYSISLGKRWGQEGFIQGTFYDAYSYFAAVTKRFGLKHEINFTAFGAPTRRGKVAPAIQEVYNIAGSNFYNPNWGYQNGEKRNARVADYHQPTFILNYKYAPTKKTNWHTSIGYQYGINANSSIDWYNGSDPRPDYYRYLPSWRNELYANNPTLAAQEAEDVRSRWQNEPSVSQVNWDRLHQVNFGNYEMVNDVNGIANNNVFGRRSVYVVGSDVDDIRKYTLNTYVQHVLNDHVTLYEGFTLLNQRTESYRRLDDLLGGDFYINYNQFAEREYIANPSIRQNDLETPNRIIKEGDKYNYHYNSHFMKSWVWAQAVFTYNKVDFFVSASGGFNSFRREGMFRNGLYPASSLGFSPTQKFLTYALKGGVTYKLNGRNYLFVNAATLQDAPTMDNTYISPRTRNQAVNNPIEQNTYSIEGGYLLRAPKLNGRIVGYSTDVKGASEIKRFYHEDFQTFVNYAMQDIDMRFTGAEIAIEYKVTPSINVTGVAALNQAFYTNRPKVSVYGDNDTSIVAVARETYLKNYYLAVGPQSAYSLGFKYSSKQYWFGTLSFNYFDRNYVDVNPDRRTANTVSALTPGSSEWHTILDQEKLPNFFTIDLFVYKSLLLSRTFKFLPKNTFLYLSLGVNNLLDNQNIRTGGFEQLRFDNAAPNKFPGKYFIGYGRNYFANVSLKF